MDRVLASEADDRSSSLRGGTKNPLPVDFLFSSIPLSHITDIISYNTQVLRINICPLVIVLILCTGCTTNSTAHTPTPNFVTAVLPLTPIPVSVSTDSAIQLTSTISVVAGPTHVPVEGTTTTQVNVRADPSTASESLGMINIFSKIQIIGKDASGSWYQIVDAESAKGTGWVRAEYVQVVDSAAEIVVIGSVTGNGSEVSGLVTQKINVRSGPAATFDSVGVLNPNDVVFITGKDPSGAWIQVKFVGAANGTGWAASEFLQVSNPEAVPVIGTTDQATEVPTIAPLAIPSTSALSAIEDGDSMQAPLATTTLSSKNARALQVEGDISAPNGDTKDWVQFSTSGKMVVIRVTCSTSALQMELWNGEILVNKLVLPCGKDQILPVTSNNAYFLSLTEPDASATQYTKYTLKLEMAR